MSFQSRNTTKMVLRGSYPALSLANFSQFKLLITLILAPNIYHFYFILELISPDSNSFINLPNLFTSFLAITVPESNPIISHDLPRQHKTTGS